MEVSSRYFHYYKVAIVSSSIIKYDCQVLGSPLGLYCVRVGTEHYHRSYINLYTAILELYWSESRSHLPIKRNECDY